MVSKWHKLIQKYFPKEIITFLPTHELTSDNCVIMRSSKRDAESIEDFGTGMPYNLRKRLKASDLSSESSQVRS